VTAEVSRKSKNAAMAEGHDATWNRGVSLCVKTLDGDGRYGERNTSRNR
jgi:hypothetical protein